MAEDEDVIVPTEGNSALDPTKASSGLVGTIEGKANAAAEAARTSTGDASKFVSRPKGGDSGKSELENYWAKRRQEAAEDLANGIKPRPKSIINDGGGHGASGSVRQRSGKFGISGAARRDFGIMKFKSQTFTDACSGAYTCIFPLSGYLPQVCGPFRPITIESIGGFPQSLSQEASNVGGPVNSDEV